MYCPECKNKLDTEDSRDRGNYTHRRRICNKCGGRYSTMEIIIPDRFKYKHKVDIKYLLKCQKLIEDFTDMIREGK